MSRWGEFLAFFRGLCCCYRDFIWSIVGTVIEFEKYELDLPRRIENLVQSDQELQDKIRNISDSDSIQLCVSIINNKRKNTKEIS